MKATVLVLCLTVISVTGKIDQEFIEANNVFTSDVYKQTITKEKGNVLVSPLSVEIVLALAQSGAKDDTAREIQTALHFSISDQKIQTLFKNLLPLLKSDDKYSLHTANKIYVQEKFTVKDDFKEVATNVYQSEIENIDFSQSDKASKSINQWVEKQTEHKIKNLVDPSSFRGDTPAMIINALYFKAPWSNTDFHKYSTINDSFFKTSNDEIKTSYMINVGGFYRWLEDPNLKAKFLEVPFKGDDAQMIFVLPNEKDGLAKLEKQSDLVFGKHQLEDAVIDVRLPLFKIESTIDFKEILQNLGVVKAFRSGEADFSGIAGNKGDLAVGGIKQKSYIDVNKDGVEAAAATNLWFFTSGPPDTNKTFIADHPFIFYIKVKDVILFAGRVVDPTS